MTDKIKKISGSKVLSIVIRIILALTIAFFLLFSFDVFSECRPTSEIFLSFLIHNIFTFILLIILFVVWKWENYGGFLLILLGLAMIIFFGGPIDIMCGTWVLIGLPLLIGLLCILNYYILKRKK